MYSVLWLALLFLMISGFQKPLYRAKNWIFKNYHFSASPSTFIISILGFSGRPDATWTSPCRGFSIPIVRHLRTCITRGCLSRPLPEGRHGEGQGGRRGSKSARPHRHFKARHVQQVSISTTYLRTAFTPVAPKSVRIQSSCQYLFTLLGSTGAKAACSTLMKSTPGINF